jgi:branched-chain amino acid aminotransferase
MNFMFEQTKWLWLNGQMIRWQHAQTHIATYSLHYGVGVFEGIRAYQTEDGPAVFRMKEHLDRLYASARIYGLEIPYTQEELADAICETIVQNNFSECYVRPLVYFGSESLGIRAKCSVETAIVAWPNMAHIGAETQTKGLRVTISPWKKIDSSSLPATAKATGNYLSSKLTVNEALSRGFDAAALLNKDGYLAEGSVENIFIVKDNRVMTNDERSSILMGITRDSVLQIAQDLGYETKVDFLKPEDLMSADEAFFTGTATEIAPICEVDGQIIGNGLRGPITKELQERFYDITHGRVSRYNRWLHTIRSSKFGVRSSKLVA